MKQTILIVPGKGSFPGEAIAPHLPNATFPGSISQGDPAKVPRAFGKLLHLITRSSGKASLEDYAFTGRSRVETQ